MARYAINPWQLWSRLRWVRLGLVWIGLLGTSMGWSQQCLNFITVNGRQLEGTPACYFISYGDDHTPYVTTELLAQILGAHVLYDTSQARYVFARATDVVEIDSTENVADALIRREGVLYVNGTGVKSTMAVRIADTGYVPIAPMVDAFHGSNSWDAPQRTVHILTSSSTYTATSAVSAPIPTMLPTPAAPAGSRTPVSLPAPVASRTSGVAFSSDAEAARNLIPIGGKFVVGTDQGAQHVQQVMTTNMHSSDVHSPASVLIAEDTVHVSDAQPVETEPIHIRPESVVPQPIDTQGRVVNIPHISHVQPMDASQPSTPAPPISPSTSPSPNMPSAPISMPIAGGPQPHPTTPLPVSVPAEPLPTAPLPASGVYRLSSPRVGLYASHTRVALDVPASVPYHLAVNGNIMVISLPNTEAYNYTFKQLNNYVQEVHYELLNNILSLIVKTTYPMAANGGGYDFHFLNDNDGDGHGVLYIDFSPQLHGRHLDILQNFPLQSSDVPTSPDGATVQQATTTPQATTAQIDATTTQVVPEQPLVSEAVALADAISTSNSLSTAADTTEEAGDITTEVVTSKDKDTPLPEPEASPNTPTQSPRPQLPRPEDLRPTEQLASYVIPSNQHRVVVIDPGHGGWDPGAQGYASEEEVVLGISLHLKRLLEAEGIEVVLTREGDTSLTDEKRSDLAARAALASGAERNLFISIHANAAASEKANGIETWVFGKPLNPSLLELAIKENGGGALGHSLTAEAQGVAENALTGWLKEEQLRLSKQLGQAVQSNMVATTGARDRGVRQNAWFVISRAQIPAILVEVGFVSNPSEGANLATSAYQQKVAQGIADGIDEFFGAPLAIASN